VQIAPETCRAKNKRGIKNTYSVHLVRPLIERMSARRSFSFFQFPVITCENRQTGIDTVRRRSFQKPKIPFVSLRFGAMSAGL
jgi:hypothetical protein